MSSSTRKAICKHCGCELISDCGEMWESEITGNRFCEDKPNQKHFSVHEPYNKTTEGNKGE